MTSTERPASTQKRIFTEIDVSAIQHPLDRMATEQLKKLRGFDTIVAKYIEFGSERISRVLNSANSVKVGPNQMPGLYSMLREGCAILDMPEPELYVSQGGEVNALTSGYTMPYIILYSGLLGLMDKDEVMAVIAHELGHIKCNHVLYMTMARQIDSLVVLFKELLPVVGQLVGTGIDLAIKIALLNWVRRAELSGDRAALLVMQDSKPCVSMLAKLAGGTAHPDYQLNAEEFLNQARMYKEEGDRGAVNRFYQFLVNNIYKGTHPFAVERAHYLNEWIDSTECDQILAGHYPRVPKRILRGPEPAFQGNAGKGKYCNGCGQLLDVSDRFCSGCGKSL